MPLVTRPIGLTAGIRFAILSFLCVVGLALAMGFALSHLLTQAVAEWEWENTAAFVRRDVELAGLTPLFSAPQGDRERDRWQTELSRIFADFPEIVRVKVWDRTATVLWSNEARLIGQRFPEGVELRAALAGKIGVEVRNLTAREHRYERGQFRVLAEVYVPIISRQTGDVVGVIEVYKTPVRLLRTIQVGQTVVWTISLVGAFALYLVLLPLVRQVYGREVRERTLRAYAGQLEQLVTERTEELQRQRETLYQAEKVAAMGQLLAGVAHELNNPLTTIIGYANLLQQRTEAGSPFASGLTAIGEGADRCARIVRNFLALARQYPPKHEQVVINTLIDDAAALVAYALKVDSIELHLQLSPDLPPMWADPHQLQQVVLNLLTNAHQALRDRPAPRRVTITTQYDSPRERVSVVVADTGPGVPPEIQTRIFDPFFTTKPVGEGTGLGLSLCQRIVEAHGGTIRVESAPGRGAVFFVELPRGTPSAVVPADQPSEAVPAKSTATVLVVDDEPAVAALLVALLTDEGHRIDAVANGTEALRVLRERSYDVIVSDIRMPGIDGRKLYQELARCAPGLERRVIFITGDTMTASTREFLDETGAPSVSKPFQPDEIRRLIGQVSSVRASAAPARGSRSASDAPLIEFATPENR